MHPRLIFLAVTPPTAERRDRVSIFDRGPELDGAFGLPSLGCYAREQSDAEYASGVVTDLLSNGERLSSLYVGFVDAAGVE